MSRHPVEALLRPPVELWSTLVALATALIALLAPWSLMMPPGVAYAAAAALALLALIRGRQALRALRYQRNMRRLPTYRLRADRIPLSRRKLFLGRASAGARSTPSACATPSARRYSTMSSPDFSISGHAARRSSGRQFRA